MIFKPLQFFWFHFRRFIQQSLTSLDSSTAQWFVTFFSRRRDTSALWHEILEKPVVVCSAARLKPVLCSLEESSDESTTRHDKTFAPSETVQIISCRAISHDRQMLLSQLCRESKVKSSLEAFSSHFNPLSMLVMLISIWFCFTRKEISENYLQTFFVHQGY